MRKLAIMVSVLYFNCSYGQQPVDIIGNYFGQAPPDDVPTVFARGIVSTDHLEHSAPAFSPDGDEVFWSLWRRPDKGEPQVIMTVKRKGNIWTRPAVAPFSGKFIDGGPCFSIDGKRLYFASADPVKSTVRDIYFVEKQDTAWSERKSLGLLERYPFLKSIDSPSIARNGTIYFMGYAPGPLNNSGIYRVELVNGEYSKPQLLPPNINKPNGILTWTPFIAPDEGYLLFSSNRRNPSGDYGDIWIACRNNQGDWFEPVMFPEPINTWAQERFPMLSPDGKYFFFTRWTPDCDHDVFWVSAEIIQEMKAKILQE